MVLGTYRAKIKELWQETSQKPAHQSEARSHSKSSLRKKASLRTALHIALLIGRASCFYQ
ncbi:MAG: hypothetical protein DWI24_05890 [Planctomycetota bacterium]|nr:MAG: hypothetical protein DWI24_05890 [Planctomycetota bacterium]